MPSDGGWEESASAWVRVVDEGDPNRELLLDRVMLRSCGDVRGKTILDAGCGEGRFSRMLVSDGAKVVALDATHGMTVGARRRAHTQAHNVVLASGEQLPFGAATFDMVVMYLVLIDIPDFAAAIRESARVIRPGGSFIFANVSFMSAGNRWTRDDQGRRLFYALDDYFTERPLTLSWQGINIVNWHRPLSAYMAACLGAGLELREFLEPMPQDDSLRSDPRFEDWYRLPNFVVMRWTKA